MATLKVEQKSIKDLFQGTKGGFLIPDYQRPYEWEEEECKTLWDDLTSFAFPENDYTKFKGDEYFLGPIVTFNNDGKMEVIDGQQRLTTLMLLLRAFYDKMEKMEDEDTIDTKKDIQKCIWKSSELRKPLFDQLKIDSQVATDDDKDDFLAILMTGECEGKKSRYAKNFTFFKHNVELFVQSFSAYFAYFPARVLDNCVLLPIEAESQDTALRIFSTLNDRGKPLADADIFKAQFYNFYSKNPGKEKRAWFIEKWKQLEKIAGDIFKTSSGSPLDELFNQYIHYARALDRIKSSSVEGLRKSYETGGKSPQLYDDEKSPAEGSKYPLLHNERTLINLMGLAEFWQDVTNQDKERFSEKVLKKLFVLNYAPNNMWRLITSVYFLHNRNENGELEDEPFYKFLDRITAFIWAYTITNPGLNSLRTPVFAEMVKIVDNKEVDFCDFKISEVKYRGDVKNYIFSNNRAITKAMLTWWAFSKEEQNLLKLSDRFDIEHIYSLNQQDKEHSLSNPQNIELLGNKSLLEKEINIRATDYTFCVKKNYYLGILPSKRVDKKPTQIVELKNIAITQDDFRENEIANRNKQIIDTFVNYLWENNLLELN